MRLACRPYVFSGLLVLLLQAAQSQQTDTLLIHFPYNESTITATAGKQIDSALEAFSSRHQLLQHVELYGHCDFIGNHHYNDSLSLARVEATRYFLQDRGVADSLFDQTAGYGKRRPLETDSSDAARAINRRVLLVFHLAAPPPPVVKKNPAPVLNIPPPPPRRTLTDLINDSTVKAGDHLVLRDLNFIGGRHYLLAGSQVILEELLKALQDNPGLKIEIDGHICCLTQTENGDGYDWDNRTYDLSVQRAKAVYEYLVDHGIKKNRLSYRGFGASRKIYPNEVNEFQRMKNRRVEILIIEK